MTKVSPGDKDDKLVKLDKLGKLLVTVLAIAGIVLFSIEGTRRLKLPWFDVSDFLLASGAFFALAGIIALMANVFDYFLRMLSLPCLVFGAFGIATLLSSKPYIPHNYLKEILFSILFVFGVVLQLVAWWIAKARDRQRASPSTPVAPAPDEES